MTGGSPPRRAALRPDGARGFIVVAVLWILAALSALVLIYLSYVTSSAAVVAVGADRVQASALISGAVELAAFQLTAGKPETRPSSGTFNARLGTARVAIDFRSEAARIDLNSAPKPLLVGLFISLGANAAAAVDYADRIVAWRTPAQGGDGDPETSAYRVAGIGYLPRHAPFPSAEELWLVRGIPPQFVERALPMVTVFSNLPAVNVLDASPQVLAALPAMTPEALQAMLAQRGVPGGDPRAVLALAGGGGGGTLEAATSYRLTVSVALDNGQRAGADVVILLLEGGAEPYRVLSWRNAFDGSGAAPQGASLR